MTERKNVTPGQFRPDCDVHITYEDQQKINKFAGLSGEMQYLKDELKAKQNDLKNLEEACDEITFLDNDSKIRYYIGEVFICEELDVTEKYLEEIKEKKQKEISSLKDKCTELKNTMSDLKTQLYVKFGNRINLETDED